MGKNLTPYRIIKGEENKYLSTPHFKFIRREKVIDNELLKSKENSVDPFDYHVSNCRIHSLKKITSI